MVTVNENCLKQNLARNMRYLRLSRNPAYPRQCLQINWESPKEVSLNMKPLYCCLHHTSWLQWRNASVSP